MSENEEIVAKEEVQQDNESVEEVTTEEESSSNENEEASNETDQQDEGQEENSDSKDEQTKNHEALDWVKKRLAQKDRQTNRRLKDKEREISELKQQVATIYQPLQQDVQQLTQGQIVDPFTGSYVDEESVDGKVVKKLQQIKQAEIIQKQQYELQNQFRSFNDKVNEARDKYVDYEDVVDEAKPYLSQTMVETMVVSPTGVEIFYNTWKNNPDKIKEISKLPVSQQIRAMHRLEFAEENKIQQKLKSNAPKPISPVKPTASIANDDSFESILKRKREEQKRQYGVK